MSSIGNVVQHRKSVPANNQAVSTSSKQEGTHTSRGCKFAGRFTSVAGDCTISRQMVTMLHSNNQTLIVYQIVLCKSFHLRT